MTRRTDKPGREHLAAVAIATQPARPGRAAMGTIAAIAISIDGVVTTYQPDGQSQDGLDAARNHLVGLACSDRLVVVMGLADVGAVLLRELDVVFPRAFDVVTTFVSSASRRTWKSRTTWRASSCRWSWEPAQLPSRPSR